MTECSISPDAGAIDAIGSISKNVHGGINMFSWLIRKIIFFIGLITVVMFLKNNSAQIGETIENWIVGREDNRVAQAVSSLVDSLSEGNGLSDAVEVFCENLQG